MPIVIWFSLIVSCSIHSFSEANEVQTLSATTRSIGHEDKHQNVHKCTSRKLLELSNKYEMCHRKNIEKIEEQFVNLSEKK